MKKLFFLLGVIALVLLVAGSAMAQKYTKNPSNGKGGYDTKYGVKAHPYVFQLISQSILGGNVDSLVANINGYYVGFTAPFTCLIDSAWLMTDKDSVAFADTVTNHYLVDILCGTSYADTAFYYTGAGEANRLQTDEVHYMTKSTTASKRYLTAGEKVRIKIIDVGTPTTIPRALRCGFNLIPPDK